MLSALSRKPINGSSPFSEFIRNAKAREQKKVYGEVLKRATERQNRLMEEAKLKHAQTATTP